MQSGVESAIEQLGTFEQLLRLEAEEERSGQSNHAAFLSHLEESLSSDSPTATAARHVRAESTPAVQPDVPSSNAAFSGGICERGFGFRDDVQGDAITATAPSAEAAAEATKPKKMSRFKASKQASN